MALIALLPFNPSMMPFDEGDGPLVFGLRCIGGVQLHLVQVREDGIREVGPAVLEPVGKDVLSGLFAQRDVVLDEVMP